jgi:hypothetical protein
VNSEDIVRIANLIGSIVLFFGALRAQFWTKKQAEAQEEAALVAPATPGAQPVPEPAALESAPVRGPVLAAEGQFEADAAKIASRPYFDRPAYWLFCIGFGITTLSSAIDLYSHHTFSHLRHPHAAPVGEHTSVWGMRVHRFVAHAHLS